MIETTDAIVEKLGELSAWAEQAGRDDVPVPGYLARAQSFASEGQFTAARWALGKFEEESYMPRAIEEEFRLVCGTINRLIGGT